MVVITKARFHIATTNAAIVVAMLTASVADAQRGRIGGRGAGIQRPAMANRAGMGQGRQDLQVRRDANANINRNTNRNVNRNVNRNLNVDVDVHHEYGYGYHWDDHYHPVARAAVVTAAAVTTAAVIGSMARALPPACVNVFRAGLTYYQCGSVWYQPSYVGTSVQYIVVAAP